MATVRQPENGPEIRKITDNINTISNLLYQVKAETPLGKTLKALINLCRCHGMGSVNETVKLSGISLEGVARLAGISEIEAKQSLDYLNQKGIISYNQTSGECV